LGYESSQPTALPANHARLREGNPLDHVFAHAWEAMC